MNKSILILVVLVLTFAMVAFQGKRAFDLKASIARGKDAYTTYCMSCHMEQGEGLENVYPPLVKSDYLMADKKRSIDQILHGVSGEMKVNGAIYNSEMLAIDMTDQEISDVLNYVRNSFGNRGDAVTPEQVKGLRK